MSDRDHGLEPVRAALESLLGDGRPRALDEILAERADAWAGQDGADLAIEALEDDRFHELPDGRHVLLAPVLAGRVFTHRLTAAEVAGEVVTVLPDLETLVWPIVGEDVPMAGGAVARLVMDDDLLPGPPTPEARASGYLAGPPGWLGAAEAGDLLALRWEGSQIAWTTAAGGSGPAPRTVAALSEGFAACVEDQAADGAHLVDVVMTCLVAEPGSFGAAAPPLTDLLPAAGLEWRGDFVGRSGRDWLPPFARALHERERMHEEAYGFSACCHEAYRAASLAAVRHAAGEPIDAGAAAEALAHSLVAEALGRESLADVRDDEDVEERAERLSAFAAAVLTGARGPRAAPAHFLRALAGERSAGALVAEEALRAALAADSAYPPALEEAAVYAAERGDARGAAAFLRRAGVESGDAELARLEELAASRPAKVGRNAPCPCGSGRKSKACCQGQVTMPLHERADWLYDKAAAFARRPGRRAAILGLAGRAAERDDGELDPEALLHAVADPLLIDLVLFEDDLLGEFLAHRGPLLPADERALAERWRGRPRALFEVVGWEPDGLGLRDTRTGELARVREAPPDDDVGPGDLLLGRLAPDGSGHRLIGPVVDVPLRLRDSALRLVGEGADADDWARWLGRALAPPQIRNTEGEEIVLGLTRYEVTEPRSAAAVLAAILEPADEEGVFHQYLEREGSDGSGASCAWPGAR